MSVAADISRLAACKHIFNRSLAGLRFKTQVAAHVTAPRITKSHTWKLMPKKVSDCRAFKLMKCQPCKAAKPASSPSFP